MYNVVRSLLAAAYLVGPFIHLHFAFRNPGIYGDFGKSCLLPRARELWLTAVMPRIRPLALLLAGLEALFALALLGKGPMVKAGLAGSLLFNLFLVQLGLGMPRQSLRQDLIYNRLPNLVLAAIQIPLFGRRFDRSIPEILADRLCSGSRDG